VRYPWYGAALLFLRILAFDNVSLDNDALAQTQKGHLGHLPLKLMRRKTEIAQSVGVSERYIQFFRNPGKRRPSRAIRAKLTRAAADYVREKLG
jgi:hypothetical protein